MPITWTDANKLYVLPMNFCRQISDPNGKYMVWQFGTNEKQTNVILVQMGFWNKKVCHKIITKTSQYGDLITYKVDRKTYSKWQNWYALKADSIWEKQKNHIASGQGHMSFRNKFDLFCFSPEHFDELSNLTK
jgi:hypothetical protein